MTFKMRLHKDESKLHRRANGRFCLASPGEIWPRPSSRSVTDLNKDQDRDVRDCDK